MMLKDKVAVIYGAGGAIGGAVAHAFAKDQREQFVADVEREARRMLFRDSQWVMDYRRLRIAATRTSGS